MSDRRHVVCSFWVYRPKDFPKAANYLEMLKILDASCRRFGFEHIVLTDEETAPWVMAQGLSPFMAELPRSLMKAITEIEARWLESPHSAGVDTIFTGADCIVRRDFRDDLPDCDLGIAYMLGHKKWRLNNGFMYVRAESREKVAPVFRLIADDTSETMCDDMLAIERALVPMPPDFGTYQRRGLGVAFLPMPVWNFKVKNADDPAHEANVLHFMGGWQMKAGKLITAPEGKALFFDWAKKHGFAMETEP